MGITGTIFRGLRPTAQLGEFEVQEIPFSFLSKPNDSSETIVAVEQFLWLLAIHNNLVEFMGESEKPQIEELADELEVWQTYREIYRKKEIDIAQLHSLMATKIKEGLTPAVQREFEEICDCPKEAWGIEVRIAVPVDRPVHADQGDCAHCYR